MRIIYEMFIHINKFCKYAEICYSLPFLFVSDLGPFEKKGEGKNKRGCPTLESVF